MSNVLSKTKQQQVIALGRLGWAVRRIEKETGIRRETVSKYLKSEGIPVRPPRGRRLPKAASCEGVITDPGSKPASREEVITNPDPPPARSLSASACEPYREIIEAAVERGRNAMEIWQELVDRHGFEAKYASVMRFVRKLRGERGREAHPVIVTGPGEEAQVDYGEGPMVRHPETGKYRRTRLFVMTLGCSRKAARLLVFESSAEVWARLHERASTLITSNRPVEDWGKLLGDTAAVSAMLDRLLHHGHVLKCGPRSWRTRNGGLKQEDGTKYE